MKKLNYKSLWDAEGNETLVAGVFNSYDFDSFEDYIKDKKIDLQNAINNCKSMNLSPEYNDYIVFKQEIEPILKRRDYNEIEKIMKRTDGGRLFYNIRDMQNPDKEKNIQFVERIYWEFYHENKNFRPELIKTPVEELRSINFW